MHALMHHLYTRPDASIRPAQPSAWPACKRRGGGAPYHKHIQTYSADGSRPQHPAVESTCTANGRTGRPSRAPQQQKLVHSTCPPADPRNRTIIAGQEAPKSRKSAGRFHLACPLLGRHLGHHQHGNLSRLRRLCRLFVDDHRNRSAATMLLLLLLLQSYWVSWCTRAVREAAGRRSSNPCTRCAPHHGSRPVCKNNSGHASSRTA